jgi:predicted phage tail protein
MMKIRLEGVAGKRFGYEHNLDVRTPKEAIRALCQLLPGFRAFLTSAHEYGLFFQIISKGDFIDYDHLEFGSAEMTLVPVITGSMGLFRNIGLILIGVLLVALSFGAFGLGFGAATTLSGGIKAAMMSLGFALVFTGIAGLFAPGVPNTDSKTEGRPADEAISSAGTGTAADGTPVPVVYGETLVTNIPVVSSYILDGGGDDPKGFWMGVISEGVIDGFPTSSVEDVYFNGLKSAAAGVDVIEFADGGQSGVPLPVMKNQGFHMQVGATYPVAGGEYDDNLSEAQSPNTSEIRSFNQVYADTVRVRVSVGAFYQTRNNSYKSGKTEFDYRDFDKDNDGHGGADNPVRYRVEAFANGNSIYDQTFPNTQRQLNTQLAVHEIPVSGQPQPISVRVTRVDRRAAREPFSKQGGSGTRMYNWAKGDIQWLSMEVLWNERLVYPKTAVLACSFKAGSVSRIPGITALIKGRRLPVLSSGLSVSYEYSDNPANVVLDLLTNGRYGAGSRSYTTNAPLNESVIQPGIRFDDIDKASFFIAQQYCKSKNITFNATISGDADTIELLRSITSTFQGQLIYAGGYVSVVIDDAAPDNPSDYRLFTEANVIQGGSDDSVDEPCFVYEGTAKKARTTAVQVSYIDKTNFYKEAKILVESRSAMQKYGYNLQKIRALGCTNAEQAHRMGRYTLATNLGSTETVSFKVGPEGALLLPGDICLIGDPLKTRIEAGGRIVLANSSFIIADRVISSLGSGDWYLYTYTTGGDAQRTSVSSVSGSKINVSGFSSVPSSSMLWVLVNEASSTNSDNQFNRYRVQKVTEEGDGSYQVIGIKYDHAKYEYVNSGVEQRSSRQRLSGGTNPVLNPATISFRLRT